MVVAIASAVTNSLNFGTLTAALTTLFNGKHTPSLSTSLSTYASVTSLPVTYSNATTLGNATNITTGPLHSITFTCVVKGDGVCVFLPQNKIHSVTTNPTTGLPEIVEGARRKPSKDSPNVILYASLDDAIQACKSIRNQIDPVSIPGVISPATESGSGYTNIRIGTKPGVTSPPLPNIWEGDYTTINSKNAHWNDGTFKPIIVDVKQSRSDSLKYIEIKFSSGEPGIVDVDMINQELPREYIAFKNIRDAVAYLSQPKPSYPTNIRSPGVTSSPPGGGGKRTRKNKKNKTGNRKNYQSLRMRKRRVHVY